MIREINENDAEQICSIYNHYIENTIVSFEECPVSIAEMQKRIRAVSAANLPWLVIEDTDAIIGYAYSSPWKDRDAYRFSVRVTIYLSPTHTGRSLGFKLYRSLFDRLKSLNIRSITGGIALPNPRSVALHEKCGMKKVAHYKDIGFKFGKWIDVAHWQLII